MVRSTTITVALCSAVVLAAAVMAVGLFKQHTVTYVRIVDVGLKGGDTSSPGADIRAVSITRPTRNRTWFAKSVVSGNIQNGNEGNNNEYKNPSALLGDPDKKTDPQHLSLGGGEIVVTLPIIAKVSDVIEVDEIGSKTGVHPDKFEVYMSKDAKGPWQLLGESDGPSTFTIAE
ncbi:MAG: hypothetical protein COW24_05705 [Candidatus Kerfeldbacteria bacterium CG15_BIG_FIL_POST_REV_8_21_14_020_45_12]|uniref:F5/8 type C domain-containing protein n=1 Tax=Candidatus Kerfeldbacteria bacterium CG15_BIG_FIL_POST_REV_8_21_14_020_45_12 TaxID=2014247 RepID=A0A2M7H2D3_9BACT|nr:MAG: hypothetical protein COW24_05705 [Candidatus Kerfeldbacteria bacterium CG15_BIG_FIL_POST_REV_8_21_14_020_45_12]